MAIKFEHKTSKGCSSAGIPYEWTMYRELRDCYGVPKLHCRGVHGDFYVMVRLGFLDAAGPGSVRNFAIPPRLHGVRRWLICRSEHEGK